MLIKESIIVVVNNFILSIMLVVEIFKKVNWLEIMKVNVGLFIVVVFILVGVGFLLGKKL